MSIILDTRTQCTMKSVQYNGRQDPGGYNCFQGFMFESLLGILANQIRIMAIILKFIPFSFIKWSRSDRIWSDSFGTIALNTSRSN